MTSTPIDTILFLRAYREATLPFYEASVADLCASPHLPHELATVLDDIGHGFHRMAALVNSELVRRRVLQNEPEVEDMVEVRIDRITAACLTALRKRGSKDNLLAGEEFERALRLALTMTLGLPKAGTAPAQGEACPAI